MGFNTPTNTFDTFADLRKAVGQASSSVKVLGGNFIQDQKGGIFYWDANSTDPDDGENTLQPLSVPQGRWKRSNIYSLQAVTSNDFNVTTNAIYVSGRGGVVTPNPGISILTNNPLTAGIVQWKTGGSVILNDAGFTLRNKDGGTISLMGDSDLGDYITSSVPIKAPDATQPDELATLSQVTSASDALNLQEVTNNGNVTLNAVQVIGTNQYDVNQDGAVILGNSSFVGLYFNNTGTTVSRLALFSQTGLLAGAQFITRVSGEDGINPTDFATLGQVNDLINTESGGGQKPTLMTIGDSITNQGINNTGTTTLRYSNQGWWVHTLALIKQALNPVFNAAVSGYTTAQVLADLPVQLSTYTPDWCWGIIGQNNLGDVDITSALNDLRTICNLVKQSGSKLLLGTVTPRTTMNSTLSQNLTSLNNQLRQLESEGLCYLFDSHSALLDINSSTGASLATTQYDNIHPNAYGALRIGYTAFLRIKDQFSLTTPYQGLSNADNRSTNPKSNILNLNQKTIGTGGTFAAGGSGTGATNWVIGRSSGSTITATASKDIGTLIYKADEWQRIDFGGSPSAQEQLRFQQVVTISSLTPTLNIGDKIKASCKLRMTGLSSNFYNVHLSADLLNSTPAVTSSSRALADSTTQMRVFYPDEVVLETQPLLVVSGTVSVRITVFIDFLAGATTGSLYVTDALIEQVP